MYNIIKLGCIRNSRMDYRLLKRGEIMEEFEEIVETMELEEEDARGEANE